MWNRIALHLELRLEIRPLAPPPPFFVGAHSKGLAETRSVSADSKEVICTKIVQYFRGLGTADSKELADLSSRVRVSRSLQKEKAAE